MAREPAGERERERKSSITVSHGSTGARPSWWSRPGLPAPIEQSLNYLGAVLLALLVAGWAWSIGHALPLSAGEETGLGSQPLRAGAAAITAALTNVDAPTTAYLTDAAVTAWASRIANEERGVSGRLQVLIEKTPAPVKPESLPPGGQLRYGVNGAVTPKSPSAPNSPGVWSVALQVGNALQPLTDFRVITMLPFSAKKNGHVGLYYIGSWPGEHGKAIAPAKAPPGAYANPAGFIEITPQNANTPVSQHFKLGDFVTHDQPNVWPKYIVLQQRIVDKLELVLADLQAHGVDVHGVHVMSGFRTPQYNYTGGNTAGRAENSRHMYGDASDIFIDNTGSGEMSDLNHDGRVTIDDARVILAAVDRVETAHPELVGGAGVYTAAAGHGPFIHIDARGYRARWVGTSGG